MEGSELERLLAGAGAEAEAFIARARAYAEEAKANGKVEIPLSKPVPWGKDTTITSVTMRKAMTGELRLVTGNLDQPTLLKVVGKLTGQPDAFLDRLELEDGVLLTTVAGFFWQTSRPTGGTG